MNDTVKTPIIMKVCLVPNRLTELQDLSDGLESCQKGLNDYLDSKRNAFPRFFFISDDELLSILGSSEPSCVQEHMIKVSRMRKITVTVVYEKTLLSISFSVFYQMYDNIASLRFDVEGEGDMVVGAMVSAEGEVMELDKPVSVEGRVEEWMTGVLLEMRTTNRLITKEAIRRYCEDMTRYVCETYSYRLCVSEIASVCACK